MNRDTQRLDFFIGKDIEEVSSYVGEKVLEFASKALQRKGSFTWVLSGGQTQLSVHFAVISAVVFFPFSASKATLTLVWGHAFFYLVSSLAPLSCG